MDLFLQWARDGYPERDKMRHDAAWQLFVKNLWRQVALGIPSVWL